jgi:NhaP-type Na+/H+ or K+/H+ antiporter
MHTDLLVSLTAIALLGVSAQWISWRFNLPSILLLLLFGFLGGVGVSNLVDPEKLFGDLLFPLVSLSVAIIMFEGGLSLRLEELKAIGRPLFQLILGGAALTWLLTAVAAHSLMNLSWELAILQGAVLVVTGPTVIIPLLRQVRPSGNVASILKWEGILIDPIGATLALLVFEVILIGQTAEAGQEVMLVILKTLIGGTIIGLAGGVFLAQMLKRYWIPDYLQNPFAIMLVLGDFTLSNSLQHESGLLSVTVMGIYLANQRHVDIHHIIEFKETLRVLLISGLFIVLSARIELSSFTDLPWTAIFFVLALIFIIRPLSVWIPTFGTTLKTKEKLFLSWLAPRGIVAASVSSVFALRLQDAGYANAQQLVSITFLVIVSTVLVYGLTAGPFARKLNLAEPNPTGILVIGAHRWARSMAKLYQDEGIRVVVADTNWAYISSAKMEGLQTYFGNALSEHADDELDLSGIGFCMALTANDEVNTLSCLHFGKTLGREKVFQLPPEPDQIAERAILNESLRGRSLFSESITHKAITRMFIQGATFKKTLITEEFSHKQLLEFYGNKAVTLGMITTNGIPVPFTVTDPPKPQAGNTVISLVFEPEPTQTTS